MIHDEHLEKSVLSRDLRDSLCDLAVPERPPLEAIVKRGRLLRRRHHRRLASLSIAAAAAASALALGLTGAHNAPPKSASSKQPVRTHPGTIRTAAFTLVSYRNGTAKLTLTNSQVFDPSELRRALAKAGIPALVKSNIYCSSNPAPPDPNAIGVLSIRPPFRSPVAFAPAKNLLKLYNGRRPHPDLMGRLLNHTVTVINPAKMPARTELAFDYTPSQHLLAVTLLYTNSHTCKNGQPPTP
jgi:hypothetical protein